MFSRDANFFQPSKTMYKTCFGSPFYSWEIIKKNLYRICFKSKTYTVTKKLGLTGTLYTALTSRTCIRKESFTFFRVTIFEKFFLYQCAVYKQRCTQKGGLFNGGGAGDRISKRSVVTFAPPVSQNFARLGANGGRPFFRYETGCKTVVFSRL
jgi:hypothetical protein